MKKLICLLMALVMLSGLCACGERPTEQKAEDNTAQTPAQEPVGEAKEWTRQGYFQDENGNMASVTWMDLGDESGWYAVLMNGEDPVEDSYGGMVTAKGASLRGELSSGGEKNPPMTVTVSEEGEDGLVFAVEGGATYHFTPMELQEAAAYIEISVEGLGHFNYFEAGSEPEDEGYPYTWAGFGLNGPATYVLSARTDDEWPFVKWLKDGEDYSSEAEITVDLSEDTQFVAVFDIDMDGQNPVMNFIGEYASDRAHATVEADGMEDALITIEWGGSAWEQAVWVMSGKLDLDTLTVDYTDCYKTIETYDSDGEMVDEVMEYENGTGRITFNNDGTFTWKGDQSEQEDLVFQWAWEPEEEEDPLYYSAVTAMDRDEVESFCSDIQDAYLMEDWATLAAHIRYPITVNDTQLKTSEEFLSYMKDKTLHESDVEAMQDEGCYDMFVNGQGICMGSGQIWLNDPNYMTDKAPVLEIIALSGIISQ